MRAKFRFSPWLARAHAAHSLVAMPASESDALSRVPATPFWRGCCRPKLFRCCLLAPRISFLLISTLVSGLIAEGK